MSCPLRGDFEICEVRDGYVYAVPHKKIVKPRTRGSSEVSQFTNKNSDATRDRQTIPASKRENQKVKWSQVQRHLTERPEKSNPKMPMGKRSSAGTYLLLITKLKSMQKAGVEYASMNRYFRSELGVEGSNMSMGMSYLANLLTYDPRHDPAKTYQEVFAALAKAPSSIDWLGVWDVIDSIPE